MADKSTSDVKDCGMRLWKTNTAKNSEYTAMAVRWNRKCFIGKYFLSAIQRHFHNALFENANRVRHFRHTMLMSYGIIVIWQRNLAFVLPIPHGVMAAHGSLEPFVLVRVQVGEPTGEDFAYKCGILFHL